VFPGQVEEIREPVRLGVVVQAGVFSPRGVLAQPCGSGVPGTRSSANSRYISLCTARAICG
jgi:hypothetical protein